MRRKTIDDYKKLASDNNLEWLGEVLPKNHKEKTKWKCNRNHTWEACYGSIHDMKSGCPHCHNLIRSLSFKKNINDYNKLAQKNGFIFKSKKIPKNVLHKCSWICSNGHTFKSRYNDIYNNHGCPYCLFKNEHKIKEIFENITKQQFIKSRPNWLINPKTNSRLELDGYCEQLKLAFEYDGQYHSKIHWNDKDEMQLKQQQLRDKLKDELCIKNGVNLIRVKYDIINKEEFILSKLKELRYV